MWRLLPWSCVAASAGVALACSGDTFASPILEPELLTTVGYTCPDAFSLTTDFLLIDPGADKNGDGYACKIEILDQSGRERIPSYVDNRVPVQVGGCPDGFEIFQTIDVHPVDHNGDTVLCAGLRPNGEYAVVDNHY
jgi:hypothetical protein